MNTVNYEWPSHLRGNVVPNKLGWDLDAYLIALEGWRRGLDLEWHTKCNEHIQQMETWFVDEPGRLYALSNSHKKHFFFRTRGDMVTNRAVTQGSNKLVTKALLLENNVPTPLGKNFNVQQQDDIINYAHKVNYPVVVKPVDGSFGKGVFSNVLNDESLIRALTRLEKVYHETDILVESFIKGKEYRIYVVDKRVVAAINRIPAHVVGNGKHSIKQLIKIKNNKRSLNPRLASCLITIDAYLHDFIKQFNYKIEDIPDKGTVINLNNKTNISLGGDSVDALEDLPEQIKEIAVKGLNSIPGLHHGAVDLIFDESSAKQTGYIIELNPTAQIGSLVFPMIGIGRDVPSEIIDYYFPESKSSKCLNRNIYFDFFASITPLLKQTAKSVKVTRNKNSDTLTYGFIIKINDRNNKTIIEQKLKKRVLHYNISGTTEYTTQNKIEMNLAINKDIIKKFELDLKEMGNRYNFQVWDKKRYLHPVKLGFEIKEAKKFYIDNLRNNQLEFKIVNKEKQKREKQYHQMLSSNSWKITSPVRKLTGLIKRFQKRR